MFYRPELGQDYVPAIEQRQELGRKLTLTPMGPQLPSIEERPEQAAYRAAKEAGLTDTQARAEVHRVVAKNSSKSARIAGLLPPNWLLLAAGVVALTALQPKKRRRRRRRR